ncbi:MAG: NAD(P)H-dependent oxidoreductase [Nitrospirales bacterium]|nr:NAD(P)H-dependent oxidoreductase [Nitrospirales bacterium]
MGLRLAIIYGSVRTDRQGIRAARFILNTCAARGHTVSLIDPLQFPLPLLDKMFKEYDPGQAPEQLQRVADLIIPADAYIIVSGEYNHTIPPALVNTLDHFLEEYFRKPSGIVCYSAGAFGGVRAAMTLRAMLAELGMSSIPSIFPLPQIQNRFHEDGTPIDASLNEKAREFLEELEWYGYALKRARSESSPRSECSAQALV